MDGTVRDVTRDSGCLDPHKFDLSLFRSLLLSTRVYPQTPSRQLR